MKHPVVRNPAGAVLGVDWRQVPGMGLVTVPGPVLARDVAPGDTIRLEGQDIVVHTVHGSRSAAVLHLVARTARGAEIVHEVLVAELLEVVAVGAFEPGARS